MKSLKPILLLLAGVLITIVMFSFKAEEPKKEYCVITPGLRDYTINNPDLTKTKVSMNGDFGLGQTVMLNNLAKEGWIVCSIVSVGQYSDQAMIYLERTKQ